MQTDPDILSLIPHRPPMLLIDRLQSVSAEQAQARISLSVNSPFMTNKGVPAWVGLEYMGQTAALIAGYQEREGLCNPHLGFLLGCRNYAAEVSHFNAPSELLITATQATLVGESLATFSCTIASFESGRELASALLSVFRQPVSESSP